MFHMGWFLGTGFGVYGWDTEWAGNVTSDVGNPDLFVYMAQSLERAGFDYMMLEDSSVLPNIFRGTFESSSRTAARSASIPCHWFRTWPRRPSTWASWRRSPPASTRRSWPRGCSPRWTTSPTAGWA